MVDLSREEFITHIELLHKGIEGVHERLDKLNDRTRSTEQKVAVLQSSTKREAAKWGGGIAGVAAIAEVLHRLWK